MISLVRTSASDVSYVCDLGSDTEVSPFVTVWSRDRHLEAIDADDEEHLLAVADGRREGFVLLAGLDDPSGGIELRRIVAERRGHGIGKAAIIAVLARCFGSHGADRVWLDLMPTNARARAAYEAVGFRLEEEQREAPSLDGESETLIVMAIRESEFTA